MCVKCGRLVSLQLSNLLRLPLMTTQDNAFVTYYDENRDVFRYTWLRRSNIQPFLDRATVDDLPVPQPGGIIGDEEARKLGGLAILTLVGRRPDFRNRLRTSTATPIDPVVVPPLPSSLPSLSLAERRQRIGGDEDELVNHGHFRDWHLDILAATGSALTIGLSLGETRTTITFESTTRCSIDSFNVANVVDNIAVIEDGTNEYDDALVKLDACERLHRAVQPNFIIKVTSAVGVNALVECVAIRVQP